ncbi:MAG: WYL domain-containing protein [Clostridia bacterium]|nr:WYL domain-containing protein [Clostridia bacterium]
MIFNELYGTYYKTVESILCKAVSDGITKEDIRKIVEDTAFSESILTIEPSLTGGKWQLIKPNGEAVIKFPPTTPLTTLQKRWLKAIAQDPRIRLFEFDLEGLENVQPLYTSDEVYIFDRCWDGDPFEDETYIQTFRLILDAIKNRYPLSIDLRTHRGVPMHLDGLPKRLEYSKKDDKFRLILSKGWEENTVNLGRILSCKPLESELKERNTGPVSDKSKSVTLELFDERNTMERALLHFAHFEKEAQRFDNRRYRVRLKYQRDDETEVLIRILSFGPFIKVIEPESFVNLIKTRLKMQKSCEQE